jgi:signal transduction histidine kinase
LLHRGRPLNILRRNGDRWNWAQVPALLRRYGLMLPAGKALPGSMTNSRALPLVTYGLLLLLSVAAIIMIFVVGVFESRDRMIAQSKIQLRQKTALLEAYVSKIFEANDMVLRNISSEIDSMPWPEIIASERVSKLLATQKQYLKHSGVIALVNREGSFVSYSEGFPAKSFSVTDRDYFRFHRDHPSDATFIGEPLIGRVYGKPSLTMSKSLRRVDGKFDGLILITMPIEYFAKLFDGAASPSDVAQLLRDSGEVIVNVPFLEGSTAVPAWFAGAVAEHAGNGVVHSVFPAEGVDRLIAYRKVEDFPFYVSYGIDEGRLLAGWRQSVRVYGTVLAAALAAFVTTAWLARRSSIALMYSNESLREVSERVLVSQDDERRSIARDLHDSTGQHLIGAAMELANVKSRMPDIDDETSRALARTAELISQSNEELRTLSYLLHPPMLDESGLPNALELLVVGFEERSGMEIELRVAPEIGTKRPSPGVELAIFRIVQEALTNIYRHSRASKATIRLVRQGSDSNSMLSLTVKDDGVGIERRKRASVGVGLSGMEARLRPLDGALHISTGKKGTTISVKVRG